MSSIISYNKHQVRSVVVATMFLFLALDMGGDFGMRNVVLPVCLVILTYLFGISFPKNWLLLFGILVIYPSISFLIGAFGGAEMPIAISQFQSTALAFVIFIFVYRIPYEITSSILLNSLLAVASLAVILAIGLILGSESVRGILSTMAERGGGYFGDRGVGVEAIIPNVYFKATLFFVPAFVLSLFVRKYWSAAIFFLALVAAVSKTGMVIAAFSLLIYLIWTNKTKGLLLGGVLLGTMFFVVIQSPFFVLFEEIAKNESGTVTARVGHFESIISLWSENPFNLLFGFGLGSTFYSSGAEGIVSNIEIDHFNVVRKYGIFWAILFFSWVVSVAFKAIRNEHDAVRGIGWALLMAFLVAGSNPVLISPIFFLFLFLTLAANHKSGIGNKS